MIYFLRVFFCGYHRHFEEIEEQKADSSWLVLLVVFEELDLAEALFRFFPSLVWATEILAFLFRNDFIPALYFLDHPIPSRRLFSAIARCGQYGCRCR
jgi:hypothetical protein